MILLLLLLSVTFPASAQEVAVLPQDPAVSTGVLPNGMKWYVARNTYVTGTADFALVQMTGTKTIQNVGRETIVAIAQEALQSQSLLTAPSVQEFFISKDCIPGPEGFAEVDDNATVFRFMDVNLKSSDAVLDSTLLVMMNIAGRFSRTEDPILKKWYMPSDQAIIVAGDVDASVVSEKLKMLSYMVPAAESVQRLGYEWRNCDGVSSVAMKGAEPGITRIRAEWRLERTPRELMNTVQPVILEKYMSMAGLVAKERILRQFEEKDKPLAFVDSRYDCGSGTMGDDGFWVEVAVPDSDAPAAVEVLAGVLASIDSFGVLPLEAGRAALEFTDALAEDISRKDIANHEHVSRCVSSFMYNTSLCSRKEVLSFHLSKKLSDETESRLLASMASPSIDGKANLTLSYSSDSLRVSVDSLNSIFSTAWNEAQKTVPAVPETIAVPYLHEYEGKLKVGAPKNEYLSGGSIYTLSNGMRVIYKDMQTENGMVHYSLSLNGGAGNIEGLEGDEGGYLSDYLAHCTIGGVSGKEFKDYVRRRGMTLAYDVGPSSVKFRGSVGADDLKFLFRVLATLMNDRKPDAEAWDYYMKGEPWRQVAGTAACLGSCIDGSFAAKAEAFFTSLAANVNNGVLVLVGKIDEKVLKTTLMESAGAFRTTGKSFTRAETFICGFYGMNGSHRQGKERSIIVNLAAPMSMTGENYYAAELASMVLSRHFAKTLAGKGMRVQVETECRRFPQESLLMKVSLIEVSTEGLVAGSKDCAMDTAISIMRKAFAELSDIEIDARVLDSYRLRLEKKLAADKKEPEYWIDAINLRYLDGKDFTTGAESKIRSITDRQIRTLLTALVANSRIEYVITGE